MRNFLKDLKGAATVFVALLLIPAMLISGSAVDLARIHTARSIAQGANQLAANSLLTQYDALLYDIYGLFGVMAEDPELLEMVNDYIEVSLFGNGGHSGLGALQVFYGANLQPAEVLSAPEKNLDNTEVLRRQIEEYMKFRGPVIIVKEFMDAIDGNSLKEDAGAINDKLEIDSIFAEMHELFERLYTAIGNADRCNQAIGGIAGGHFASVSTSLVAIRRQFVSLSAIYTDWESEESPELSLDYAEYYQGTLDNIRALTVGGPRGSNWGEGGWQTYGNVAGLNSNIENAKLQADNFKPRFDLVVSIATEIDTTQLELKQRVDALENRLNSGEVSDDLRSALTEPGPDGKSQIERYRELLNWDNIEAMAAIFSDGGYEFIDDKVKPLLDSVIYRNVNDESDGVLTRELLADIPSNPAFALSTPFSGYLAAHFAEFPEDSVTYGMAPGFMKFAEFSDENREFFDALTLMMSSPNVEPIRLFDGQENAGGVTAAGRQRNMISSLLNFVQTAYAGLSNDPLGAEYLNDSSSAEPETLGISNILRMTSEASSAPIVDIISNPLGSVAGAGDYLLLLTYATSMFSNYTTTKPESNNVENLNEIDFTKTISGIPISPEVNYFFQSEWEYLYNGSENSGDNLSAITRMIFIIRLISNYITVFKVTEVTTVVLSIKAAFAWNPPLALILGELARAAFVAAETIVDVSALRSGHKVPLIKNVANGEWVCSPSGLLRALEDIILGESVDDGSSRNERGLSYSNYMLAFFITKSLFYFGSEEDAATELAKRTKNLIEWNIINYKNHINADEERMTAALGRADRFQLCNMKTDFSISFAVDLRMLFLSMPLAQRGIEGVVPPIAMPVTVTDYRGY